MSFSQSNINSQAYEVSFSGTKGIATGETGIFGILYYSEDSGANWATVLTLANVSFYSTSLSGEYGIAVAVNTITNMPVIYWTNNGGSSWTQSVSSFGGTIDFITVSISGLNAIIGLTYRSSPTDCSVYRSINGGITWNLGFSLATGISESINNVTVDGNTMIVVTTEGVNSVIRNSLDSGVTWNIRATYALITSPNLSLSGSNAIYIGENALGGVIKYSTDNGTTWNDPTTTPSLTNNIPRRVSISGSFGITGGKNGFDSFIWWTTDSGNNWTASSLSVINLRNFISISESGVIGLAAINTFGPNGYLYYSTDQGATWSLSLTLIGNNINDAELSGYLGIAGTSNGIYYSSSPLCYEKNTLILVIENEEEIYKKVSELKVGDLVKTYKNGNKKIKLIRSFNYKPLNKEDDLHYLYKMKDHDVILTAGHSILVDELTEQEQLNNDKYNFKNTIEDKKLLLACSSDKFERIEDDLEYELWHFALENDDVSANYGVYINDGVLSESCSEKVLLLML